MDDLSEIRKEIDAIDKDLLKLIARRLKVVKRVGEIKKRIGKPIKDKKRESDLLLKLADQGAKQGVSGELINKIWKTLFQESYTIEK